MSRRGGAKIPRLDLRLNLSPPQQPPQFHQQQQRQINQQQVEEQQRVLMYVNSLTNHNNNNNNEGNTPPRNSSSSASSCLSSENEQRSPEPSTMLLAGCSNCMMYVMCTADDPRCPKCYSTVLIEFGNSNKRKNKKR